MRRLTRMFNFATPFGGVVAALLLATFVFLLVTAAGGLGIRFDPFNGLERRAATAEATASAATSDAIARGIEAAGERDTTTRVEVVLRQTSAADRAITSLTPNARTAPDANVPLDPDRVRRLVDVDQQLCAARPAICFDRAASASDAGDGLAALQSGRPPS